MNWDEQLFAVLDDLEQQAEALYGAERDAELADRSRAEYASVTLASRLMASLDRDVALSLRGVGRVEGTLQRVGTGWALLQGAGGDWVVHLDAVSGVAGASPRSTPEVAWSPLTRLGLGSALRRLGEAQEQCLLHLRDGGRLEGRVRRVGADFAEVEVAPERVELIAFAALAAIQSR
ncbi:hypothetical protein [Nocardioides euryhalodurans]|uniref:hypothetical protein n=1 Tax=Nocardioides euryhalodurans TaxID=2518370 RepID=UPI00141E5572|nr:hypothetical protein [Nocardioides euryhalodurans]